MRKIWLFAALAAGWLAGAGEPGVVEFAGAEPHAVKGLRLESYQGKELGDADRLVLDTKNPAASPSVTVAAENAGLPEFGRFALGIIAHHGAGDPLALLTAEASSDGTTFTPVALNRVPQEKKLPGGYRDINVTGNAGSARFLRIGIRNLKADDYWKLQLARLRLSPPLSREFKRTLPVAFNAETPMKLQGFRLEAWQQDQHRLDAPRLVLDGRGTPADTGTLTLDMSNFDGADAFRSLELDVLCLRDFKGKLGGFLTLSVSDDGRSWSPVELRPVAGRERDGAPGYTIVTFAGEPVAPSRLLKLQLNSLPAKEYWKIQPAAFRLKVNGEESAVPETAAPPPGKIFQSETPAAGARLELKLHTLGAEKLKFSVAADGRSVPWRFRDTAPDGGGWRTRTVEVWPENGVRELNVLAKTEPEWAVRIEKVDFVADRDRDRDERLGGERVWKFGEPMNACRAAFLQSRESADSDDFSSAAWGNASLSPDGYRGVSWAKLPLFREPGAEIFGTLYRFRFLPEFDPSAEEPVLVIPQSAFVTDLYVDGKKIAHETEGFLPFEIPLAETLTPGREAEVVVKVRSYRYAYDEQGKTLFPIGAMSPWTSGMPLPPVLEKRPKIRSEKLFVHGDAATVRLSARLLNHTGAATSGSGNFIVTDGDGGELLRVPVEYAIPAGGATEVAAKVPHGGKLKLWDIGQPNLYFARFELPGLPASEPVRFGCRSLEIKGDSLFLNGRKIRLFGPWSHIGEWTFRNQWRNRTLDHREVYQALLHFGMNVGRLHCQPYNKAFYDAADEAGFLLIAETALAHRPANEASLEHVRRFTYEMRNHPSVILYSGSNEFEHWITPRPEKTMTFLADVRDEIRKIDPTRPVQHSGFGDAWGKLDVYNIHYPAETGGFPRTLYWTRDVELLPNRLYYDNFKRFNPVGRKPIAYGEERIPGNNDLSFLFGEAALRARLSGTSAGNLRNQQMLARDWALRTRAEREQNVLLICPNIFYLGFDSEFVRLLGEEFRPAGAYPKFRNPVLAAGKPAEFPLIRFEDSGFPFRGKVHMTLRDGERVLAEKALHFESAGGTLDEERVTLEIPARAEPGNVTLTTETFDETGKKIHADVSDFRIVPPFAAPPLDGEISVWGSAGLPEGFVRKYGLKLTAVDGVPAGNGVLAILPDVPETELLKQAGKLADFAARGGHVMLFERIWHNRLLPSDAAWSGNPRSVFCIGFVRDNAHPVTAGVDDLELRYWADDFALSTGSTGKPEHGNFRILVDGGDGLGDALLWELPHGRGGYLVNHLDLLKNADTLPQAEKLLYRMFRYLLKPAADSFSTGAVLAGERDYSAGVLYDLGWKPVSEATGATTVAVTAEALKTFGAAEVAQRVKNFRNILIFNASQPDVGTLAVRLAGSVPATGEKPLPTGAAFFFTGDDAMFRGSTSADLNWNKNAALGYRFHAGNGWTTSIGHGADALFRKPDGGVVYFCNLPLDREVASSGVRARLLSQLSTNLGVALAAGTVRNQDVSKARFATADLSGIANASREAFFGEKFPAGEITLGSIPFRLPKGSAAKAENFFRFNAHGKVPAAALGFDTPIDRFERVTPKSVTLELPVDQAETIAFLQIVNRNWKIERFRTGDVVGAYLVHFTDGSSQRIPLVFGENIAECRGVQNSLRRAKAAGSWLMTPNGDGENGSWMIFEWENPTPEKKIRNIELVNGENPPHDLMLMAVTIREPNETFR